MEVQIDHVVALSNAWQTGAFKLTAEQRKALANDPMNLFAVKAKYSLWVVAPEKAAMLSILAKCPTQKVPLS